MNADEERDPLETPPPDAEPESGPEDAATNAVTAEPAPETAAPVPEDEAAPIVAEAVEAPPVVGAEAVSEPEPEPAAPGDEPVDSYDLPQALFDAGFDVEAALGALAFDQDDASDDDVEPEAPRLPPFTPPDYRPALPVPAPLKVRRGQLASIVPGLVLIGVGAWLTVANVTGAPADPLTVGAVLAAGLVLSFAVAWLTNGRWSRGLLLVVLLALFAAGGGALILNAGLLNALAAYPLLLSALGVAILLAGLFGRPRERAWLGPALVFILAGIVGTLVVNGAVPAGLVSAAGAYWFVPAVILLILVALPLFFRRRA